MLKSAFKRQAMTRWQSMWNLENTARALYEWIPTIGKIQFPKVPNKLIEIKMVRLTTGCTRLNANMHRMKLEESPLCVCGNAPQTIEHIMRDCTTLKDEIKHMHESLDAIYILHDTPVQERDANTLNFFWPKHTNSRTRAEITKLLYKYQRCQRRCYVTSERRIRMLFFAGKMC